MVGDAKIEIESCTVQLKLLGLSVPRFAACLLDSVVYTTKGGETLTKGIYIAGRQLPVEVSCYIDTL